MDTTPTIDWALIGWLVIFPSVAGLALALVADRRRARRRRSTPLPPRAPQPDRMCKARSDCRSVGYFIDERVSTGEPVWACSGCHTVGIHMGWLRARTFEVTR
jgi:hypothetical protein